VNLDLDYKEAKRRYPAPMAEVLVKIAKGKNKQKGKDPSTFKWSFSWYVRVDGAINGTEFMKMVAGKKSFPKHEDPPTAEAAVEDYFRRVTICLAARLGSTEYASDSKVSRPKEIADFVAEDWRKDKAETERIAKLTVEERDAETADILGHLRGSAGFFEMRTPARPPHGP